MLEIVHDLAPGAQLFFATANGGPTIFAQNIRSLRAAGFDIITKSPWKQLAMPPSLLPWLPAEEKNNAPAAVTSLTAWAIAPPLVLEITAGSWPSWNGVSTK